MRNIVMVAGQPLDIDSLPLQGQKELVSFFDFVKFKFKKNEPTVNATQEDKVPSFEEFFKTIKGRLPKDYNFDRDEANAR